MALTLKRVEIWSDVEANGGTHIGNIKINRWTQRKNLAGEEIAQVEAHRLSASWSKIQEHIVLRPVLSDDSFEEWRVTEISDIRRSGEIGARLKLRSIRSDLGGRETGLIERGLGSGIVDPTFTLRERTPSNFVDIIKAASPSYFEKGNVDPTDPVTLVFDHDTPLSSLTELEAATGAELNIRRNGTLDYRIDLLTARGGSADNIRFSVNRNMLSEENRTTTSKQATRIYARGEDAGGIPLTLGKARWSVTAVSGTLVTLGNSPIRIDDQFNTLYLLKSGGGLTQINDTLQSTQQVDVVDATGISVGDKVSFRRDAVGNELTYIEDPTAVGAPGNFGVISDFITRQEIPDVENELDNPFLNNYTASLPDGWTALGGATLSEETDLKFVRHGESSLKIVSTGSGQGVEKDAVTVDPTIRSPHFNTQVHLYVAQLDATTKGIQLQIEDVTNGRFYPPRTGDEAIYGEEGRWVTLHIDPGTINFYLVSTTSMRIRVITIGGGGTFYLDAAQLENKPRAKPTGFVEVSGGQLLWQVAQDELALRAQPEQQFRMAVLNLGKLDEVKYPRDIWEVGATGRIVDADIGLDFTTRIFEVEEDLVNPARGKVILSARPEDLVGMIARRGVRQSGGMRGSSSTGTLTRNPITDASGNEAFDPDTGQIGPGLKFTSGFVVDDLEPAEAGADVTGSNVAANVVTVSTQPAATVDGAVVRTLAAIDVAGDLLAGVLGDDGTTKKTLLKAGFSGQAGDGDAVTYPVNFQDLPAVSILPAGLVDAPGAGGGGATILDWLGLPPKVSSGGASDDVLEEVYADAQSVSGFTLVSKINERSITVAETTDTFGAGTLTAEGQSLALGGLSDDADDDEYRVTYDVTDLSVDAADSLHTVNDAFPGGNLTTQGTSSTVSLSEDPNSSTTVKYSYTIEATADGNTPLSQNFPGGNITLVGQTKELTLSVNPNGPVTVKWDRTVQAICGGDDDLASASGNMTIVVEKDVGAGWVLHSTHSYGAVSCVCFAGGGSDTDNGPASTSISGLVATNKIRIRSTVYSQVSDAPCAIATVFTNPDKVEYTGFSATTQITVKIYKNIGGGFVQTHSDTFSVTDTDGVKDMESATITRSIAGLDQGESVKVELFDITETGSGTYSESVDPVDCEYTAGSVTPSTVTLKVSIDKKDGLGPWEQAATPVTYTLTDTVGTGVSTSFTGEVQIFTDSAIVLGDDIRVKILELSATNSPDSFSTIVDPVDVKFNIFTGTETLSSKTPLSSDNHEWIALGAT